MRSLRFRDQAAKNKISVLASNLSLKNADYRKAYEHVRSLCYQQPDNVGLWNTFGRLTAHLGNFLMTQKVLLSCHFNMLPRAELRV